MKALVFGVDPGPVEVLADANRLQQNLATTPMAIQELPDPELRGDDWLVLRTRTTVLAASTAMRI